MSRDFARILDDLGRVNPFFSELKKRVILNSAWKMAMGEEISNATYVCEGKDNTLEIWTENPVMGNDLRFMSSEILKKMEEKGFKFKKVTVKRLRGGTSGSTK